MSTAAWWAAGLYAATTLTFLAWVCVAEKRKTYRCGRCRGVTTRRGAYCALCKAKMK